MPFAVDCSELSRFRAAVESAPVGLMAVAADGRIVLTNGLMGRMFGYEPDELLGVNVEQLVPERLRGKHRLTRASFHARPQARAMGAGRDLYAVRRDGSEFPVEISLNPLETEDGVLVIGAVVDITARRKDERERAELELRLARAQRLESLGRLAGGIAHDFNNVLATILSLAELAKDTADGAETHELDAILESTSRGRDLVQRILLFSRGQASAPEPVALAKVVPEVLKALGPVLPAGVDVRLRVASPAPVVRSDPTSIHQIVSNLVMNASRAMPNGGSVEISVDLLSVNATHVRTHPGLREGLYGRIEVVDSGVGMDAATRERAFEPFFTTRSARLGSGLGLAIVHGLTHDRGGAVWLDAAPTGGTRATALLPLEQGEPVAAKTKAKAPHGSATPAGGKRVLFIEDEPVLAAATGKLLTNAGYAVTVHTDPLVALTDFAARADAWDVVVTDHTMPKVSGLELAAHVRRIRPDATVILMTGRVDAFEPAELAQAGAAFVVAKPVAVAKLVERIEEAYRARPVS